MKPDLKHTMNNQNVGGVGALCFDSLNVRGLRNTEKRNKIFNLLKSNKNAIHFLQETHTVQGDLNKYTETWGPECYLSHGTSSSRGTAIIIPKEIKFEKKELYIDTNGRYVILVGNFNDRPLTLINLYAPTQDKPKEQIQVLEEITDIIKDNVYNLIWGGDFNTHLCPRLDVFQNKTDKPSAYACKLLNIMEEWEICDAWRIYNPEITRYTWRKFSNRGIQQSRIDYFLVSNNLLYEIEKTDIEPSILTDHSLIILKLHETDKQNRGNGIWKQNASLLKEKKYIDKIKEVINMAKIKYKDVKDLGLKWDVIKSEIRGATISYASYKAKVNRQTEKDIRTELKKLEVDICENPNEDTKCKYLTMQNELKLFISERTRGAQIRAKCDYLEYNEQNTAYFLNLEKTRSSTKNMQKIVHEDGSTTTNYAQILTEQKEFYEKLYSENNMTSSAEIKQAEEYFLNDNIHTHKKIDDTDRDLLDSEITIEELANAVKELPNNKSPGIDGIIIETYKMFWNEVKDLLFDSITYGIKEGRLSIDQRRGILSLVPKKDKNITLLKNWRPLTLLNCDYKIFAKTMAKRLQTVLDIVIDQDQSGCIKGRSALANIRSTLDVINFAEEYNTHGLIAMVDYEKAFDTVKWSFMLKCLKTLNFGEFFINCVKTMYEDINTSILNNGFLSSTFKPQRGIKQGCPISANLFVILVEFLADAIRQDKSIRGIQIGETVFKISQFADDTCLYIADENSLENVFNLIELFSKCAGLKVNKEKSEAMWIGASSNYRHKPFNIKWTKDSIKTLGIYVNLDRKTTIEDNFNERLKKIKDLLEIWNLRKLTLKGKVIILNTLIISQMIYISTVLYTPKWVITEYQNIITNFLWNKKPAKIKYTCLINSIENGGLKLQDLETKIRSIQIKWIQNIADTTCNKPWKAYLQSYFKQDLYLIPYMTLDISEIPKFKDPFYNSLLKSWTNLKSKPVETIQDICKEILWGNKNIKIAKKSVNYNQWRKHNIILVYHLLDNKGRIASKTYLEGKFNFCMADMDYNSLMSAIPKSWKKKIRDNPNVNDYPIFLDATVLINKTVKKLIELTSIEVYKHLITLKAQRPTSEERWESHVGLGFTEEDWADIYQLPYVICRDTKVLAFQMKITHRILACKHNLSKWKIEINGICNRCQEEEDIIEHHLVACKYSLTFWDYLFNWIKSNLQTSFPIDTYDIVFGIPNPLEDPVINQINFLLLHAKYYIYVMRQQNKQYDLYEYLIQCKNNLNYEQEIMRKNNQEDKIYSKWEPLINLI
jgi:exonuclease III